MFAKTPCIPFFRLASLSQSSNRDLTLLIYPSFSFSMSLKNFNFESFILNSVESVFILSWYSFDFAILASLFSFIASNFLLASFLLASIS